MNRLDREHYFKNTYLDLRSAARNAFIGAVGQFLKHWFAFRKQNVVVVLSCLSFRR